MIKIGKCIQPFLSNEVVGKTISTNIVVSTRQLALLVKTENKMQNK